MPAALHHVVIVGGGFGGLYAARALRHAAVRVTLIDRHNHHLFQPLLYQVATGGLSPANIAAPLRGLLSRQQNADVVMAEVTDINVGSRHVVLANADFPRINYDTLIVATGSQYNYFGHPEWERIAPPLKSIDDATTIRRRVLGAFEKAELETDRSKQQAWMTFVIVGGGPTGVELAGALAEVAHHTLARDFRRIRPQDAQIILCEGQVSVLGQFPPDLRQKATASLARLGVTVRVQVLVTQIDEHGVTMKVGERQESIAARTVLWTAGVVGSPLGTALAKAIGLSTDRAGRLMVEPDLSLPGHAEIFVIGDLANCSHQTGEPLPGVAPVAMQQGQYVTDVILRRLEGQPPPGPFHYHDRGNMATIGRASAVADLGWLHLSGYLAWLTWLFVHLMYLVQFQNRVLVFVQWAYCYFTRDRSARLITHQPPDHPQPEK